MASSASSSFMRLSLRSSWERRVLAWSVASLACRRSSHFSRSSRSFSLARAFTASSLSCRHREGETHVLLKTLLPPAPRGGPLAASGTFGGHKSPGTAAGSCGMQPVPQKVMPTKHLVKTTSDFPVLAHQPSFLQCLFILNLSWSSPRKASSSQELR